MCILMITSVVSGKVAEKFFLKKLSLEPKKSIRKQTSIDLNVLKKELHQSEQLTFTLMKMVMKQRISVTVIPCVNMRTLPTSDLNHKQLRMASSYW